MIRKVILISLICIFLAAGCSPFTKKHTDRENTKETPQLRLTTKKPDQSKMETRQPDIQQPPVGRSSSPAEPLSFDMCFTKCKELVTRTDKECFDTCLKR